MGGCVSKCAKRKNPAAQSKGNTSLASDSAIPQASVMHTPFANASVTPVSEASNRTSTTVKASTAPVPTAGYAQPQRSTHSLMKEPQSLPHKQQRQQQHNQQHRGSSFKSRPSTANDMTNNIAFVSGIGLNDSGHTSTHHHGGSSMCHSGHSGGGSSGNDGGGFSNSDGGGCGGGGF